MSRPTAAAPPTAELLAIGTELLGGGRLDSNSVWLADALAACGILVSLKWVLPDDEAALADALRAAIRRAAVVICTGGLGPTADDRTRAAAAQALGVDLVRDPELVQRLEARARARRRAATPLDLQQADRPATAEWLPNDRGSACGAWAPTPAGVLVLLPGPPEEMRAMFEQSVAPRLRALAPAAVYTSVLKLAGMGESDVDAIAAPLYRGVAGVTTTILANPEAGVELRFRAQAQNLDSARAAADALADRIAAQLGPAVFSRGGESLPEAIGRCLRGRHQTLAFAESCTGGMLGERITAVAGSSDYFLGGVVSYGNAAKQALLGVPAATIERHGAVSEACAIAMAQGARQRFAADWGLSVTGIAGPGGGTPEKPVGTVWVGCAGPAASPAAPAVARLFHFHGTRGHIRRLALQYALNQLRLALEP